MVPPLPSLSAPHSPLYTGSGVGLGDAEADCVPVENGARDLDLVALGDAVVLGPIMQ